MCSCTPLAFSRSRQRLWPMDEVEDFLARNADAIEETVTQENLLSRCDDDDLHTLGTLLASERIMLRVNRRVLDHDEMDAIRR